MKFGFVLILLVNVAYVSFAIENTETVISGDFVGHKLVCVGQCHKAQSSAIHLASALGIEPTFMINHLKMASRLMAQDKPTTIDHNLEGTDQDDESEDEDDADGENDTGYDEDYLERSCEEVDCARLESTLDCSTEGSNSSIGFVPLLSTKNNGYIFASVSSGIEGLRNRYFSLEGEGGRAAYTIFVGSPRGAPTTMLAILQPTRIGSAPKGPLKFLIEQAVIYSTTRARVALKSKLYRRGKFRNSECEFDDDTPFKQLPHEMLREIERDSLFTANEYFRIGFGRQTNITSVEVTLGSKQCMAIVLSTAPPCCVINSNISVSYGTDC